MDTNKKQVKAKDEIVKPNRTANSKTGYDAQVDYDFDGSIRKEKSRKIGWVIHGFVLFTGLLFFIMGLCLTYAKDSPDLRFWWMTNFGILALAYIIIIVIYKALMCGVPDKWFTEQDGTHNVIIIHGALELTGIIMTFVGISLMNADDPIDSPAMWITGLTLSVYVCVAGFAYLCGGGNAFVYWLFHSTLIASGIILIIFGSIWVGSLDSDGWWMIGVALAVLSYVLAVFGRQYIKHSERKNWFTNKK